MFRAEVGLRKLRIGVVSYLNAMPLWYALRHEQDIELVPDTPARLAAAMAADELDLGLLPVVEALRDPRLSFFPDLGIGAAKPSTLSPPPSCPNPPAPASHRPP